MLHKKTTWLPLLAITLTLMTLVLARPALADDGMPGGLGQGNQTYTPSAQDQQLIQEKQALANELQLVGKGTLSAATYQHDLAAFYQRHGIRPHNTSSPLTNTLPGSDVLYGVIQIAQTTSYYCGPASAEMVLKYLGADTPGRRHTTIDAGVIELSAH